MKFMRTTLAGAVLVVAGLLATGVGPALVPWASAQSDPKAAAAADPASVQSPRKVSGKWEYAYVEVPRPVTESAFESACRSMEPEGWEYSGTQEMTLERRAAGGASKRGSQLVLVFKRPVSARRVDGYPLSAAGGRGHVADAKARIEALEDQLKARRATAEIDRERALYAERLQLLSQRDKAAADAAAQDLLAKTNAQTAAAEDMAKLDAAKRERLQQLKNRPDAPVGDDWPRVRNSTAAADAPQGDAKRAATAITIIPLGDGSAEKMAKMLTDLFGRQGTFQADDRSNSLVIKADAQTLAEVQQLIERLEKQAQAKKERDMILKDRAKSDREKNVRP